MSSANVTCGLRDSSVYASERNVVISTVRIVPSGRRRWAPIVPNRSPWVHTASPQPRSRALTSGGRASVVRSKSCPTAVAADEQVADGATDEVQPVAGRGEPLGQRGQLLEDRGEAFGHHDAREGYVAVRRPRRWAISGHGAATRPPGRRRRPPAPGPPLLGASGAMTAPANVPSTAPAHADSASRS